MSTEAGDTPEPALPPVPEPTEGGDYNPQKEREKVRGWLALGLLGLLAILVAGLIGAIVSGWRTWPQLEGVATLTFTPLVSLTGTVLGFYFGQLEER